VFGAFEQLFLVRLAKAGMVTGNSNRGSKDGGAGIHEQADNDPETGVRNLKN
jgi:hypothetical protein